jgi:hypothetical protein
MRMQSVQKLNEVVQLEPPVAARARTFVRDALAIPLAGQHAAQQQLQYCWQGNVQRSNNFCG